MDLPDPPEGWALKSLIEIDPSSKDAWSAQLWAEEAYVYGYGSTPRFAMLDAIARVERNDFFEKMSGMSLKPLPKAVQKSLEELLASIPGPKQALAGPRRF